MSFAPTSHLSVLEPQRAHAALGADEACGIHDLNAGRSSFSRRALPKVRLYTVRSGTRLSALLEDGRQVVLERGVTLRLDGEDEKHFREDIDYFIRRRLFCVLDGEQAGTCWQELLTYPLFDEPITYVDLVEPLTKH